MTTPSAPPPTYNESMQQSSNPMGYPQSYGAVPPTQQGGYPNAGYQQGAAPPYPSGGQYDPYKTGPYDPSKQGGYPSQPGQYPGQGGYPPQQGQYTGQGMPPPMPAQQSYQSSIVVQPTQQVVLVGGCPACRVGGLEDDFTCFGVCCAILFFPIGILCCLAMRQRRCSHCGAVFG